MTGENVLVVVADDMRADFLQYMVRLAGRPARRFTRARVNTGLCGPSRWSHFTGQWQRDHQMDGNPGDLSETLDPDNILPLWIKDSSVSSAYRTGMFGKYLNLDKVTTVPSGFDVWRQLVDNDEDTYRMVGFGVWDGVEEVRPPGSMLDHLRDEVLAFAAEGDPWVAWLCPTSPHSPFNPLREDLFAWSHIRGPEPPDIHPSKPSWFHALAPLTWEARSAFRAVARAQARELTALDRMLDQLFTGLGTQLDNTIVMFTSDNGLNFGENRQPGVGAVKHDLTEASVRVPMVCFGPGFTAGDSTAQVSSDVDVNATVVAITGCDAVGRGFQRGIDLRSLQGTPPPRPLLHERSGSAPPPPNAIPFDFIFHTGDAVSTETRKLMHWTANDTPGSLPAPAPADEWELYDLENDPLELVNVINTSPPAEVDDLKDLLASLLA